MNHAMEIIEATPPSRLSSENAGQKALERAGCMNTEMLFCKHPGNYIGEVLVLMGRPDYTDYLLRIYDADALLRLVRAQLEYKLAAKQANADSLVILARLPPETFNPYTDKPFDWDTECGVLWFKPGSDRDKDKPVEIRLPKP
ncbi:MAG: hypothetical protein LBJ59_07105 [Zoogloeaceae bacterium]|jgi:hypothetical protein|nr:hypothetical protein [Zoogloeaceae bacterium]